MKVISTNIAEERKLLKNGIPRKTGIFKKPVSNGIIISKTGVTNDVVSDKKHHGGPEKAVYIYLKEHYPFWEDQLGAIEFGGFGENLTLEGILENQVNIGDELHFEKVVLQISQPRVPCWKLNAKFDNKTILKQFVSSGYCGFYCRVIQEGAINSGETFEIVKTSAPILSVLDCYNTLYTKSKEAKNVAKANPWLSDEFKEGLR